MAEKKTRRKKKGDDFSDLRKAGIGIAGLGVITGIGAGIQSQAPAHNVTRGFSMVASFAPVAVTAIGGYSVLKIIKKRYR